MKFCPAKISRYTVYTCRDSCGNVEIEVLKLIMVTILTIQSIYSINIVLMSVHIHNIIPY